MDLSIFSQITTEVQSLGAGDIVTVFTLAALEGILSVDNSLVLAILVRRLPEQQRKKALTYGIAGAFLFRLIALIFAVSLMRFVAFKAIGGGYLIYLAMKHMFFFHKEDAHGSRPSTARSFWKTVLVVELTDIAFAVDSITTAVAMSKKLVVIWMGGIMGIIFLRFAAGFFVRLLERLPKLEDLAYQLIFFIGVKLFLESFHVEMAHGIFWMMMGVIVVLGSALVYRDHHQRKTRSRHHEWLLERLEGGEIDVQDVFETDPIPREAIRLLMDKGYIKISKDPVPPVQTPEAPGPAV